jgi:cyanophycin synthetase
LLLVQGRLISAVRYDAAASSYTDVTGAVHAEVTARAADSARILGLDIAGVDVVARCIDQPLEASPGAVIEVNASPDLRPHLGVDEDDPRGVGAAIVDLLIPAAENGRIPIAAISGTNGKTTVTRFIAHLLRGTFGCVGMTCTDGIYLNDRRIDSDDCSGPISAGMVLTNRSVDAAVCETARGGVLRAGLAFDECTIAVVTNIADGDHLGLHDINTAEDLAKVKRAIVDVVAKDGAAVLNADDPLVVAMAPYSPGRVVYFALDPDHHVIRDHRGRGGQAVFVRDRVVTFADGEREDPWIGLDRLPLTFGGAIAFEIENALAALAAAHAMGVPRAALVERAAAFAADMAKVPGRFNVLDVHGATVIVDYGHNAHSLRAVVAALDHFPHQRRSAMYSMAGDRRDSDIVHIGELLGGAFDRVILYEAHTIRGRSPGAIAELLRQGAFRSSRVRLIEEFEGSIGSMEYALDTLQPGDLLLLQADAIDETVDWVRSYLGRLSRGEPLPPLPAPVRVDRLEPHPVTAAPPADAAVPRGEDEIAMAGGQPSPGMKMRAVAGMRIAPLRDTEANHPQVSPQIVEPREPPIGPRGQSGVSPIPKRLDPFSEEPCTGVLAEAPAGAKEW